MKWKSKTPTNISELDSCQKLSRMANKKLLQLHHIGMHTRRDDKMWSWQRKWSNGKFWVCIEILPETKPLVIQFDIIWLEIVVFARCFAIPATSVVWSISSFPLGQVVISTWRSRSKNIQETNWGAEWCGLNVFCHQQDFSKANSHVPVWTSRVALMTLQFFCVFVKRLLRWMGPKSSGLLLGCWKNTKYVVRNLYPSCSITSFRVSSTPHPPSGPLGEKCVKNGRKKKKVSCCTMSLFRFEWSMSRF